MKNLNELRWNRIKEAELPFIYIKSIVKRMYDYEIKESNVDEFIINISNYINIDEGILLLNIERDIYIKLKIFSLKDLKKYDKHPIEDELTNPMLKMLFEVQNNIKIKDGIFGIDDLDSFYRVIYYKEEDNKFDFRLACIKRSIEIVIDDLGCQDEIEIYVYDSVRFIVDLDKRLVFMYYNDILEGNFKANNEVTNRKRAFMELFRNVNTKNLISFDISNKLLKYFNEYLLEIENNNPKKLISMIETVGTLNKRNSLSSIADDFKHAHARLVAIDYAINNEDHDIATLECIVNSHNVRLRREGYIMLPDSTFQMEVIKDVWKEFFE